jgi:outer membrane protein TolC
MREKLKAALDAATQGYSEGRTPLLLYLEAQRTYFDTQADYFDTLQKVFATQAELESAIGVPLDQINPSPNQTK